MRYVNPLDHGAIADDPSKPQAQRFAEGVDNREVIRGILENPSWRRYDLFIPENIYVNQNQLAPAGGYEVDQTIGPWFWLNRDLEVYGVDSSIGLIIDSELTAKQNPLSGFRLRQPYSLKMSKVGLRCTRLWTTMLSKDQDKVNGEHKSNGILFEGKPSDDGRRHYLELDNVECKGFVLGVYTPAGPVGIETRQTVILEGRRTDIVGDLMAVAFYAGPTAGPNKLLQVGQGARFGTAMRQGLSSHCFYVHPGCNYDFDGATFHHWLAAEYGLQIWGNSSAANKPSVQRVRNCLWEGTGLGYAMVTGYLATTKVYDSIAKCRTGFQLRGNFEAHNLEFSPNHPVSEAPNGDPNYFASLGGSAAFTIGALSDSSIDIDVSDSLIDNTEAGVGVSGFDMINSSARVRATRVKYRSRMPATPGRNPAGGSLFTSSDKPAGPYVHITAKGCKMDAYDHPTNAVSFHYASMRQGTLICDEDCGFVGDAPHDRAAVRADANSPGLQKIDVGGMDLSGVTRGAAIYMGAGTGSKLYGSPVTGGKRINMQGQAGHLVPRRADCETPLAATIVGAKAKLVLSSDFDTFQVPSPGPGVCITEMAVNFGLDDHGAFAGAVWVLDLDAGVSFLDDGKNVGFSLAETSSPTRIRVSVNPVTRRWQLAS